MENENFKKGNIKSGCLGTISLAQLVSYLILLVTIIFQAALMYGAFKDLPVRMSKNEAEIALLKTDFSSMKTKIDIIYDFIQDLRKKN